MLAFIFLALFGYCDVATSLSLCDPSHKPFLQQQDLEKIRYFSIDELSQYFSQKNSQELSSQLELSSFCLDFKYDGEKIKICELQLLRLSGVDGPIHAYHDSSYPMGGFWAALSKFNLPIYFMGQNAPRYAVDQLLLHGGKIFSSEDDFEKFYKKRKKVDPSGILVGRGMRNPKPLCRKHKDLITSEAGPPLLLNKALQRLLILHADLKEYQPEFRVCNKHNVDIVFPLHDYVIIKPTVDSNTNGIIVTKPSDIYQSLRESHYWKKVNPKELFLVEELIRSKPLFYNNDLWDPTLKAFVMAYKTENGSIDSDCWAIYIKRPNCPITDVEASMSDQCISAAQVREDHWEIHKPLPFEVLDAVDQENIRNQLQEIVPRLFKSMLALNLP